MNDRKCHLQDMHTCIMDIIPKKTLSHSAKRKYRTKKKMIYFKT